MDTHKFGFILAQLVIKWRDKWLPEISKIVGKVDGDISKEYLVLLMWTATWKVAQLLGQYVDATLEVMHAVLYDVEGGPAKDKFQEFLNNRYEGYYSAIDDESGEGGGMRLYHVANYFLACCNSSGESVKYEELKIALLLELDKAGFQLRDGVAEKIRHLYDTKNLPTYPMDIQATMSIILDFDEFCKGVQSLICDLVKAL